MVFIFYTNTYLILAVFCFILKDSVIKNLICWWYSSLESFFSVWKFKFIIIRAVFNEWKNGNFIFISHYYTFIISQWWIWTLTGKKYYYSTLYEPFLIYLRARKAQKKGKSWQKLEEKSEYFYMLYLRIFFLMIKRYKQHF